MKRKIVRIDEDKCNGCGLCASACAEGAIEIVDGKAKLVGEILCDGLGACLGTCPQDAITIEEREAEAFSEAAVHQRSRNNEQQSAVPKAGAGFVCPGRQAQQIERSGNRAQTSSSLVQPSELTNWPVQLKLVPAQAPYFDGCDLLVAADCTAFSYGDFHRGFLKGRVLLVGCPKLDDVELYRDKLSQILAANDIRSIEVLFMEVPCCFGLTRLVDDALSLSGKDIPTKLTKISLRGEVLETRVREI
ncbi:MAG TPA: 4Fe-4S binding protein [bacterium]|nr:4Fe-4S binding protein [bacterium]